MPASITTTPAAGAKAAIAAFATSSASPPPRLVLFTATRDAATGVPWCPDCARSINGVRAAVGALKGSLLEVEVARPEWKDPGKPSPLRAEYGITGIPALVLLGEGGAAVERVLGSALEGAGGDAEAEALVKGWVGK